MIPIIPPGTYVRPIDSPENWEVVQSVDDKGAFVGQTHITWSMLLSYWEFRFPNTPSWHRFDTLTVINEISS